MSDCEARRPDPRKALRSSTACSTMMRHLPSSSRKIPRFLPVHPTPRPPPPTARTKAPLSLIPLPIPLLFPPSIKRPRKPTSHSYAISSSLLSIAAISPLVPFVVVSSHFLDSTTSISQNVTLSRQPFLTFPLRTHERSHTLYKNVRQSVRQGKGKKFTTKKSKV